MSLSKIIQISLFKSLYFNLKCFGIRGLCFPVIVSRKCRISIHGTVKLQNHEFNLVRIGFGGSAGVVENPYSYIGVAEGATLIFKGKAGISAGSSIRVEQGTLLIGEQFSTNKNCFIACSEGITIGDNVTLGWNVSIRDNDGHTIIDQTTNEISEKKTVKVGNHVWLCSFVDVLKGAIIPDESVVAYRSLVTKDFTKKHILIGGVPAKVLRENIRWEY